MPHYNAPRRSATPPSYPYSQYYPGINPYETELPLTAESSAIMPYSAPSSGVNDSFTSAASGAAKAGGGFSIPNLGDIKGIVDRFGGIEGILATMGKVQKMMQTFQQFAPMAKLVAGLLPGGKGAASKGRSGGLDEFKPRRRRKKGTKRSNSQRRSTSSKSRSKSGKSRR
ncbi:hypothetical protein [Paenibacillus segetis]|jgi:hypothetical protein|uniref:Tyrosine protein kinase n=1 Tax=Paenibacillus segetis TaxID=1325360 RepID=A0ABQ1Y1Y3_9BACL|nr:hypothetical protein [Paenibacillus segetis]GGH10041.1 hypothetical protein GCM10008013_01280 [Paenibacillus segetis]